MGNFYKIYKIWLIFQKIKFFWYNFENNRCCKFTSKRTSHSVTPSRWRYFILCRYITVTFDRATKKLNVYLSIHVKFWKYKRKQHENSPHTRSSFLNRLCINVGSLTTLKLVYLIEAFTSVLLKLEYFQKNFKPSLKVE